MPESEIISRIRKSATARKFPDGSDYTGLDSRSVADLSSAFGMPGRDLEILALQNDIIPERYIRNMNSLSIKDQICLLKSKVTVVGLGGLGGTVAEILARSGVGSLRLIDGDCFEDSNLNRQLFSSPDLLGKSKAETARRRVSEINPSVSAESCSVFLDKNNADELLTHTDVAVDCLDNIHSRFLLESSAKKAGIPLVSAAVAGASGHITTIFPQDRGLENIYGPAEALGKTVEEKGAERVLGCLPHGVFLLSALEASEVIRILLKKKKGLRNRLLLADLADNTFEIMVMA